jgi:hypothetical protein
MSLAEDSNNLKENIDDNSNVKTTVKIKMLIVVIKRIKIAKLIEMHITDIVK